MDTINAKFEHALCSPSGCHGWQALAALFVIGFALFPPVAPANADPLAVKVGVIHEAHSR
jgi:hypothetical protein